MIYRYRVRDAADNVWTGEASDVWNAQELAIEHWESCGIPHDSITSIVVG